MMLELNGIRKTYEGPGGEIRVLDGVSLHLDRGEFVAVQGPSGCGKSTLLLTCGGLLAPDEGKVTLAGKDVYGLSSEDRARLRAENMGFVFQQFHLIPYLDVMDNILIPCLAAAGRDASSHAKELLARFGLDNCRRYAAADLSVGERQRVGLARALLLGPKLLLADEPTGNLDADNSEIVLQALAEFAEAGGSVLLVTHDAEAASSAQRILNMADGAFA